MTGFEIIWTIIGFIVLIILILMFRNGTMLGYKNLRRSDNIYLEIIIQIASIVILHKLFDDTLDVSKVKEFKLL